MTRRKFMRIAGSAVALAGLPLAARMGHAGTAPAASTGKFGGLTPNADFYVTSNGGTPMVDVARWRLKIYGLVDKPLVLSMDDITRMPRVKQALTLECIGNRPNGSLISNAEWTGVKLRPLLERAGVRRNAVYAAIRGADGYSTGIALDEMMRDENWMPFLMNGVPLPVVHGYPLRVFIPGKYGMKQPKWLTEIEFVDHEYLGYYETRGWSNEAWRKVNSGFFSPAPDASGDTSGLDRFIDLLSLNPTARVKAPVEIAGWALAGPSGVKRVQISTDDGATWNAARLVENESPYVWTVWKYRFAPSQPGEYSIRVRATDGAGRSQPAQDPDTYRGQSAQARMKIEVISIA
jgi:DMSO/TMAO reductase YedYZ molybdopterin-dependent catalytic subunit